MDREKENTVTVKETETLGGTVEDYRIIKLREPIMFEGNSYSQIDLTRLDEIKAADMVAINRRMARSGSIDITPELTLEYALNMANLATGLPLEFFDQLQPYAAMAIKGRVTNFLYRQG
ncbi:MAG: phage tail assembly protein [Lachnospiraceae bacterium]|nr:phage tail assembly protein [Lachnospiraceae bacterium]